MSRHHSIGRRATVALLLGGLAACATPLPAAPPPPRRGLTEAQIGALLTLGFTEADGAWEFGLSDKLLFPTNENRVASGQGEAIARIVRALLAVDIRRARVEGHTDATGGDAYNDALSLRRATAVADVMVEAGMRREDLAVRGLCARQPVEDNRTSAGRRENRRVVLIIDAE